MRCMSSDGKGKSTATEPILSAARIQQQWAALHEPPGVQSDNPQFPCPNSPIPPTVCTPFAPMSWERGPCPI